MNGTSNGTTAPSQPAPTPVPQQLNGDMNGSSNGKSVKWTGTEREILEIQKTGASIGLNVTRSQTMNTHTWSGGDSMKFISLASPLVSNGLVGDPSYQYRTSKDGKMPATALRSLPMRPTLHREKQIPGRFFPSPSYTEFQRDVLESRPTPRRIIKKLKPSNGNGNKALFPAGSPVKPRTAAEKSTWLANQVYSRGSNGFLDRGGMLLPPDPSEVMTSNTQARQYSIPAKTIFYDGDNNSLVTGKGIQLHEKSQQPNDNGMLTNGD